jgi:hypothetical protein
MNIEYDISLLFNLHVTNLIICRAERARMNMISSLHMSGLSSLLFVILTVAN